MVSIIVPAYNAGRWLPAAVRSVLAQTEQDWELVLVDDGSTDATPGLCDGYAASDLRIRVEHTPNAGVSAARNRGLRLCRGQWIMFLDADDVLHPDMIRIMLDAATRHNADMVSCATYQFHTPQQESDWMDTTFRTPVKERVLTSENAIEEAYYQTSELNVSSCAKLYNRNVWHINSFYNGRYEDLEIACRLMESANRIVCVDAPLYGYRQNPDSYMHRFTLQRLDVLTVTEQLEAWGQSRSPEILRAMRDRRMSANFNIFMLSELAARRGDITRQQARDIQADCYARIRRLRRNSIFNSKSRLKNRIGAGISLLGPGILRKIAPLV
jgi:hypothetical protein